MNYVPHTEAERQAMLKTIGVDRIEDLFEAVPEQYRFPKLDLPPALTEMEMMGELQAMADGNADASRYACFLGAGAYNHYIPSIVNHILLRGEFFTAYTPYQPEVSQGTLQSIFEFQSMMSNLTGMDVCTASHYDGATAFAEAALMAVAITKRPKVLVSRGVHPMYREVLATYTQFNAHVQIVEVDVAAPIAELIDGQTAAVCIQNPNFLGQFEDVTQLGAQAHAAGALFVAAVNPISLGLFQPPSEYGADIVVGEGQPLGVSLSFGGPYLGFFCTKRDYMRRIPGRIVGETVDRDGKRGYVLTLKTREQDIRREKATSNICTNQGLMALAACVYMAAMGKNGLQKAAHLSYQKAHYAAEQVGTLEGFKLWGNAQSKPFFNEFVVKCPVPVRSLNQILLDDLNIIGGYDLGKDYPELENHMLIACTETNTREEIDALAKGLMAAAAELRR